MTRVAVYYDLFYFSQVCHYIENQLTGSRTFGINRFNNLLLDLTAKRLHTSRSLLELASCRGFCGSHDAHRLVCTDPDMKALIEEFDANNLPVLYEPYKKVNGRYVEDGVDVKLTCNAFEHSGEFDLLLLVSNDGDFAPLVDSMKSQGKEVVVPQWSYQWREKIGQQFKSSLISPSARLKQRATAWLDMMEVLFSDQRSTRSAMGSVFVTS